jgi:ACS family D-galactonate transporter-like MFS transporter
MRWSVVILLGIGMIIAYIDRANLSVALADPHFKALFRLSDNDRGLLNSAFFWTYAFLQIPAGFLVDRFGVKYPYALAFVLWSVTSAATGFISTFAGLCALRLLLGVGEAVVTPASMRWIRFNVGEKQRGLAVGILFAGAKFGPAVGSYLAAILIHQYGWQPMFMVLGLGCLLWLIPWMLLVKDNDREIEAELVRSSTQKALPFAELWKTPMIYGVILGTFSYNYFVYFSMTWMPAYLVERRNLSLNSMGLYQLFSFSGMAVMAILAGFVADKLIERGGDPVKVRKGFTIAGLLAASTELIGAVSPSTDVAVFFAIVSLTGLGLATANYWALTQTLMPGAAIGRIAGVQNFASNFSGIVAPLLTGWLKEVTGSYVAPMIAICVFLIMGIAAYLFMVRAKYAPGVNA